MNSFNGFNSFGNGNIKSWAIWDFFNQKISNNFTDQIYAINCHDAYIEKMIINSIPKKNYQDKKLYSLIGSELTETIIDNIFFTLDLFTNNLSYYILMSDDIKLSTLEYFLSRFHDISDQTLFLFFRKKSPTWKLINSSKDVTGIEIKALNFWEGEKIFNFLTNYLRVSLPYNLSLYLIETLELDIGEYIKYIKLIKMNFTNIEEMTIENVKKLILRQRVDKFTFATTFCRKDFKMFYKLLSNKEITFDQQRDLFAFLQSHLLKLMDTSYCAKKKRLTKYDKEIISLSKTWDLDELSEKIQMIQEYELRSKLHDLSLDIHFKQKYLQFL